MPKSPTRGPARAAALLLLIVCGLVQGGMTGRWVTSRALAEAVARLDGVPETIGDWEGRPLTLDRKAVELGGIRGHVARAYSNRRSGQEVSVLLVCGRSGPISVHTPDVCYGGVGFVADAPAASETLAAGATFKSVRMRKPGITQQEVLDVRWSWNSRGIWEAPDDPRLAFASYPSLSKLYIISRAPDPTGEAAGAQANAVAEFAREFLPALDRALRVPQERRDRP